MSAPWRSATPAPYPLMPLAAIKGLPVSALADKQAHLYLWAVNPMMREAYEVIAAWGFKPRTVVTWCKRGPGLGGGWRGNTEHLIVARRGNLPFLTTRTGTWYVASRRAHSQKPDVFIDLVEQMSPGPYLELFSRQRRLGWDVWGNEVGSTVDLAPAGAE